MNAYVITLTGQGDTDIKIVDQETFQWVTSDNLGRAGNGLSWDDKTCPDSIRKRIWGDMDPFEQKSYGSFENFHPHITIGSPDNDRALFAPTIKNKNGENMNFFDTSSFANYVTTHRIHIQDSYEGYIY